MKFRKMAAALLALGMTVTSISVSAASSDLDDTEYYQNIKSVDFQDQTAVDEPSETANSGNGIWEGYVKEEDGNIYWYGYRAEGQSGGTTNVITTPGINKIINDSDPRGGEYVIENKIKFDQTADNLQSFNLQVQLDKATDESNRTTNACTTQMGITIPSLNAKDADADAMQYYYNSIAYSDASASYAWVEHKTEDIPGFAFSNGRWYIFRQTYNLDLKTLRFQISGTDGTQLYDYTVNLPTVENGKTGYALAYDGTFSCHEFFYAQLKFTKGNGYGLDDIKVSKTVKKPVTVNYNSSLGDVSYNGKTVANGAETAVSYGADAVFAITPSGSNKISSVKVNGTPVSFEGNTVTLAAVKADQTIDVEFEKGETAPEGYETVDFSTFDTSSETVYESYDDPYANGSAAFEFYDNGVIGGLVAFKDGANKLSEYFKLYDADNYTFAADRGSASEGEETVNVARSEGAHKIIIKTYTDSYDVYLDGTLVHKISTDSNVGIKQINVQNKSGKRPAGSAAPTKLYCKAVTRTPLYKVNVTANDGGTASVDNEYVEANGSALLTVKPNDNYEAAVTVDGSPIVLGASGTYEISGISKDTAVVVTFAKKASVTPSVEKVQILTNAKHGDSPAAVFYAKITGTVKNAGVILKNADGNEIPLAAMDADDNLLTNGAFGIKVFGQALKSGEQYKFIPYVTYAEDDSDKTVKAEEETFTFGE